VVALEFDGVAVEVAARAAEVLELLQDFGEVVFGGRKAGDDRDYLTLLSLLDTELELLGAIGNGQGLWPGIGRALALGFDLFTLGATGFTIPLGTGEEA
jgi:hypothetical protein